MNNITIKFLLKKVRTKPYYEPKRPHLCYELVYCKSGSGCFCINDVNVPFRKGTYALFPTDTIISESGNNNECIYLGFEYNNTLGELSCGVFDDIDNNLLSIIDAMENEVQTHSLYSDVCLDSYLMVLLYNITRKKEIEEKPQYTLVTKNSTLLSDIIDFFDKNYDKQINISKHFESIGYSYHHLRHSFKEIYGISPSQYLLKKRIDIAKKLLLTDEYSLEEISAKCGFNSVSHFVSNFKRETETTPAKFREERI